MDDSSSRQDDHRKYDGNFDTNNTSHIRRKNIPFGLNSFDAEAQETFGRELRVFMAFKDGSTLPPEGDIPEKAMPDAPVAIARRLKQLSQEMTASKADQLELLVRYDAMEGWKSSGARHCVAWMNLELGISPQLGWEYLRVGRKLRTLPITRALFRGGNLTWSVVRLLSRVADQDNEALLCHTALDASVSDVERFCNEYRWLADADENSSEGENAKSLRQIDARSLTWKTVSNGNTLVSLSLPPEVAKAFLNSVEQSLNQLDESADTKATLSQRRADAAVLMAENSLQNAGRDMATADRYQVIVSVDSTALGKQNQSESNEIPRDTETPSNTLTDIPEKRPIVHSAGPIAVETVRRIACDCTVSTITHSADGEPINFGRKSRLWSSGMTRAIKQRDQHCQFPGCTHTRHLQIHHIQHWADGGYTCVNNGVCVCAYHHTVIHEGGLRMERVSEQPNGPDEQFFRQLATADTFNQIEERLRDSRESFELVRKVCPTRFRFRVVNECGLDIRDVQKRYASCDNPDTGTGTENHSTHVGSTVSCTRREDSPDPCHGNWPGVAEKSGHYRTAEPCI